MAEILKGGKQLEKRLLALERNAQRTILSRAVAAGAVIIRDEARKLAPRDPASKVHAADAILSRRKKVSRTRALFEIGYSKKKAWYLRFAELGTKFHAAQPHLRPAMDTKKEAAVREVGRVLKDGIDVARRA